MIFDFLGLKEYIDERGIKQKAVAEKAGIDDVKLCMILQGKRKCEAGEYVSLCNVLGVNPNTFMKSRLSNETKN